jgi:H+/Cl- antiporter ClcA
MKIVWKTNVKDKIFYYYNLFFSNGLKLNVLQAIPFYVASLLVGLVAVGYTKLFVLGENILNEILQWHYWMIFIMAPLCFLSAWLIIYLFAPAARGSGIPQVMAAIELANAKNDKNVSKLLSFRILVTKIVSSLLMVLGGGAIGREGPTIQIAGSIFRLVNKAIPDSWPKLSRQSYILTGAAAGLAAAFNTPLGGIVFAMEELAQIHIKFFRSALFSAVIIAGLTAQGFLGPYLYLGYPNVKGLGISIFLGVVTTAIASGLLGAFMGKAVTTVMKWTAPFSWIKKMSLVIGSGLLVAFLATWINHDILGSGKDLMNQVLFTEQKTSSFSGVAMRILGPIIAFNTGAAGGVFAPSLAAGASIGTLISDLAHLSDANANILILSGMVGFLTGVTRTPFTSAILVLEMTDRHSVIFHLMLAAMISNFAALLISKHSFYEELKKNYIAESTTEPLSRSRLNL